MNRTRASSLDAFGTRNQRNRIYPTLEASDGSTLSLDFTQMSSLDSRFTFTRSTTATFINNSGYVTSAAINAPRFDYDPTTLATRGLLIEGSATNLLLYSNEYDPALTGGNWGGGGYTFGTGATSPDGSTTARRLTVSSGSGATCSAQQSATVSATSCTFSIWWKNGNHTSGTNTALRTIAVRNATTATILLRFYFDPTTLAVTYVTGSTGASIVSYQNGWYRIIATVTSGITSGNTMTGYFGGLGAGISGESGTYCNWWGAQLEASSGASSYIPTSTSTVQRAADSCVMSGTNFSSWFNASQGTMLTTWSGTGVTSGRYATINDGSASNQIWTGFSESAIYNGSFQASFGSAGTANGKVALAYLLNDAAWCLNGGSVSTDTAVTLPTGLNQISIGNSQAGTAAIGTAVRTVKYFPTRLPDSTLRSLTL